MDSGHGNVWVSEGGGGGEGRGLMTHEVYVTRRGGEGRGEKCDLMR